MIQFNNFKKVNRLLVLRKIEGIGCSVSRFLIYLLLLPCYLLLVAPSVQAQVPTPTLTFAQQAAIGAASGAMIGTHPFIETPEKGAQQIKDKTVAAFPYIMENASGLSTYFILAGIGDPSQQQVLGPNGQPVTQNGQPVYETVYNGGAIEVIANLTSSLYSNKPASSVEYLADLGSTLGIVKPTYAQGLGFSAFSSILELWKIFRNIAYLAFVIIFIIVGFMIMFRKKIDPRTVVTIQDALPRIIITLILITFSYAIAGLIIDAGDFLTKFVGSSLQRADLIAAVTGTQQQQAETLSKLYNNNVIELINPIRNVDRLIQNINQGKDVPIIEGSGILGQLTIRVIFVIAGIFIMFKIFFALLGPYISIILSIIFAPILLLFNALPGSQNSVGNWLKGLLAKVLVFPATFAMIAMAAVIKGYEYKSFWGGNAFWDVKPGFYTSNWSPAVIGNWGNAVGDIVAFGILFTIPHVVSIIQNAFQIKAQPWESASGKELQAATSKIPLIGSTLAKQMQ